LAAPRTAGSTITHATAGDNVRLAEVNVTNNVNLSRRAIVDLNAGAVNVLATSLVANAVTGISLDTTIANLTATNTTSGGIASTKPTT
jgi:hypothetical protein